MSDLISQDPSAIAQARAEAVEKWLRPEIRALQAYHVPPAEGLIKLDAMENPHAWPPALRQEWAQLLSEVDVNRYPSAGAEKVKAALAEAMAIPAEHGILLGNGSDEIIQLLAMAVAAPGRSILAPEPAFVMYKMIATYVGMDYVGVPLDSDFDLDLDATLAAIKQHQPALIFLALPNNPTGNLFSPAKLEAVIEAAEGLVVLDEAYTAFTEADHLDYLARYSNVLVMRTVSKIGLAGLRLGLLVGATAWLNEFEKLRLPYNINVLTQLSASFALKHYDVLLAQTADIRAQRQALAKALAAMPGVEQWPSEANFILMRCADARQVHQAMCDAGVLVKCLDGAHPSLANCLRLTVGSAAENEAMLAALSAALDLDKA